MRFCGWGQLRRRVRRMCSRRSESQVSWGDRKSTIRCWNIFQRAWTSLRARLGSRPVSWRPRSRNASSRASWSKARGSSGRSHPVSIELVGNSYWLAEDSAPIERRALDEVDVEIIGAGITGCSAALALARDGLRVRVRDRREIAEGASGRNGGFALRGGAARYDVGRETYGVEAARELWRRTETELAELELAVGDAFRRTGSLRLAADDE